jgi:hypothetical protein
MHWGVHTFYNQKPGIEFMLIANGIKNGLQKEFRLKAFYHDAFEFTALAIVACVNQYMDNKFVPNLYLMGNLLNHNRLIADLKKLGVRMTES